MAAVAAGGGIGAIIGTESDWYDGNNLAPGLEPASLAELHGNPDAFINWDYVAGRVVTEPTGPCALPPTDASADRLIICPGGAVQLSATPGTGGDTVDWFTGACGDLPAGSGTSITVSPASDSTYFARTRNAATGCVSDECVQVGPVVVKAYAQADFNRDCAVDELDLMIFTACAFGPHIPYDTALLPEPPPGCTLCLIRPAGSRRILTQIATWIRSTSGSSSDATSSLVCPVILNVGIQREDSVVRRKFSITVVVPATPAKARRWCQALKTRTA